jgi:aminoglycoside phosphotransferase
VSGLPISLLSLALLCVVIGSLIYVVRTIELRYPNFYKALETGAIERYRTGAAMNEEDVSLINSLEWPNGVRTTLFNQPLPPEGEVQRLDSRVASPPFSPATAANVPCSACSWTAERQNACHYYSGIKLFYGTSDRGVWSLGSQFILKERSTNPPNFEAQNIHFLKEKTSIPVPTIVKDWKEDDGRYFMLTERICGEPLNVVWPTLSTADRERIAKQTAEYLLELRELQSLQMQSLDGGPIYSAFLFPNGYGVPHGPLSSDDELWGEMVKSLEKVPEKACQRLRQRMPTAIPSTFTHGDLTDVNIVIKDNNLAGILDWEASGYFPVWWEFTCAGIGLGKQDQEWKSLLRKYMPDHSKAREFWLSFYALRRYPNLDEEGEKLLQALFKE